MESHGRETLFTGGIHSRHNHRQPAMIVLGSTVAIVAVCIFALMAFYLYANGLE